MEKCSSIIKKSNILQSANSKAADKTEFNTNSMAADKNERNYDDAFIRNAGIAWGAIKKAAMQDDFESQAWFVSLSITISTSTNNTSFI